MKSMNYEKSQKAINQAKKSKKAKKSNTPQKSSVSSKGQVIRASIFQISENMLVFRIGPFRIVCQNKYFSSTFRRATRDCVTAKIYELEYLRKLKRNTRSVFFSCSLWFFYTFRPKMDKICIILPEIISKTLYLFDRFSWIFLPTRFFPENPASSVCAHYCSETF